MQIITFGKIEKKRKTPKYISCANFFLPSMLRVYVLLTLKTPRKSASENVVCFSRLLNILANFLNLFLHTGKQCGPRSDSS